MARYPTIDTPPTALDGTPLPYQRLDAPLAAFGGRQAQALGQLSDTLQKGIDAFRKPTEPPQEAPTGKVREPVLHDIAASNAVDRFRLDAQHAHADYSSRRHGDAIDGYPEYRQALQDSRDQLLNGLQGPARSAAQPHLDRLHNESLSLGLQHRHQQDQAWSDHASQASLDVDLQEALLWRNNPIKLQRVVDRAGGEWMKLAERKGWDEQQTGQQIAQWNGRLYDTVIGQHLHDGHIDAAQTILTQAQDRLDPDTFDKLQGQVIATAGRIEAQRNAQTAGGDFFAPGGSDGRRYGGFGNDRFGQPDDPNKPSGQQFAQNIPNGSTTDAGGPGGQAQPKNDVQFRGDIAQTSPQKPSQPRSTVNADIDADNKRADKIIDDALHGRIGYRGFNIGNMRPNGDIWDGRAPSQGGFETSTSAEYGVRMNAKNLVNYEAFLKGLKFDSEADKKLNLTDQQKDDMRKYTIANVARHWAPKSDPRNDPDK